MNWTIITGATSGVGAAVARRMAGLGRRNILLIARRENHLKNLVEKLAHIATGEVSYLAMDISNPEDRKILSSCLVDNCQVDTLVNAAGIGRFGRTTELDEEKADEIVLTNLLGLYHVSRIIIPLMTRSSGTKTIINVSSESEAIGRPDGSIYCASKGGVFALTLAWQIELRKFGIRVCNVAPGRVDTHFNNKKPGDRPGALTADEVAEVIIFAATCSNNIDIQHISINSMSRLD